MKILLGFLIALMPYYALGAESTFLADKPYELELVRLQHYDPKPLTIQTFTPDPSNSDRAKGLRIASTGRIFPLVFEIISIQGSKPEVLEAINTSLDNHEDIVLKTFSQCDFSEKCLHYFQQFSEDGKPHHVSSNYIFLKNDILFHLSASNYAALVIPRPSWGEPRPDPNAEDAVKLLMRAFSLK